MTDSRPLLVAWANYFAGHTDKFVYSEGSDRMSAIGVWPIKYPIHADCSAFVTLLHWYAGCEDPNGTGFDHEGYTGTLLGHGTHIKLAASDEWPLLRASAGKPGRLDFLRGQFKNLREGLFTSSASY